MDPQICNIREDSTGEIKNFPSCVRWNNLEPAPFEVNKAELLAA